MYTTAACRGLARVRVHAVARDSSELTGAHLSVSGTSVAGSRACVRERHGGGERVRGAAARGRCVRSRGGATGAVFAESARRGMTVVSRGRGRSTSTTNKSQPEASAVAGYATAALEIPRLARLPELLLQ